MRRSDRLIKPAVIATVPAWPRPPPVLAARKAHFEIDLLAAK
jgi:hypothetical protein